MSLLRRIARRARRHVRERPPLLHARELPALWHEAMSAAGEVVARAGAAAGNPIVRENQRRGTRPSAWDIRGSGDPSIQGFATDISVAAGATVSFKIATDATAYAIEIFRLGYYGGRGARKVADIPARRIAAHRQPPGVTDPDTGLLDCGNWAVSASWDVPADAVSGVYIAKLTRGDTGGASHVPFVVRDDASMADILFQTSDTTWQAYNRYGGKSLYSGSPSDVYDAGTRARKLSYNRPFFTRGDDIGRSFLFSVEYPALRFLERNGYDVAYATGIDTDRRGPDALRRHRVFLSVGHDEYWSARQRMNVQAARDAGVHLMFLSGNEMYWRIRFEPSSDGMSTPYRTLVCYKDTVDNKVADPSGEPTATWRDPRLAGGPGLPENALTGTMTMANDADFPLRVTAAEGKLRLWRATGLASMRSGSASLAPHIVGYESDEDADNGFRPPGLIRLSTTTGPSPQHMFHFGAEAVASNTEHHVTLYRAASGSLVFSAGTVQWAWGLDRRHDGIRSAADRRIQQATVNMLADMGVRPAALMPGLSRAEPSADGAPPTSVITTPSRDEKIPNGTVITVRGTAADVGGGLVAGVEVSIDGGASWHPADGTSSWSYAGVIHGAGPVTIMSRATDDSANTEVPPSQVEVVVTGPCTLFGLAQPSAPDSGEAAPAELGVRFRSELDGYVTGVRFYKTAANTGRHTGTLWSADGQRLAVGTFADEALSGWQTLEFPAAVPVKAGQTYVASYFAPHGHYCAEPDFFYYRDYSAWPLVAEVTSVGRGTGNGVRAAGPGFPAGAADGTNYYVDVVFSC
jgi:Domain of unknown function (DUF4082)/Bacterial Ig domain